MGTIKNISLTGLFFCLMIVATDGYSQKQSFTQYYLNLPSINPGFTGMEPFLDMKGGFRQRWNGFDDKNNSVYLSGYASLGRTSPTVYKNNSLRISNPDAYASVANASTVKRMHGIGGMITSQTVGPFKSMSVNFNYAYHLPLSRKVSLSMGTRVGLTNYELNFNDYVVRDPDGDLFYQELLKSNAGKQQHFVGDFGMTFYSDKFFMGFSSHNLVTEPVGGGELLTFTSDAAYEMVTGVQLELSSIIDLYPGGRLRHSELYGTTWEANVRVRYDEMIYLGVLYENDVKAALLFGLTFDERYNINYSYDYYLNDLREFNAGNHEFTIGIAIFNKYSTPARLW